MAGRPRFQKGQVTLRGDYWVLRYRDHTNGGKRETYRLALAADHPDIRQTETSKAELRFADKISKCLAPVNQGHTPFVGSGFTVGEFIEKTYFPRLEWRKQVPDGNEL